MRFSNVIASAALAACIAFATAPAAAETSIAGGLFTTGPTGGAVFSLTGPTFAPLATQLSLALPFSSGSRYALTGEILPPGPIRLGFGGGFGKLSDDGKTGIVLDALLAEKVAPHTSVVVRYYQGVSDGIGSTAFLGLQFSL
jgi:hypothetical protein